ISILSMALAAFAVTTLISRAAGSVAGGVAASALLMLNPNVLYLQSTPMTEPLLFGTTFLAVALIAEWAVSIPNGPASNSQAPRSRAAGWSSIAAVLTRYAAWPIVAAAIGFPFLLLRLPGFPLPL